MSNPVEFVKKHKIVFGVSAIALIGVVVLSRGGGGGGSVSTGPTQGELDMNTQLGLAQISASIEQQRIGAEVAGRVAEINAQQAVAVLQLQNENLQGQRVHDQSIYATGVQASLEAARIASNERITINTNETAIAQTTLLSQTQIALSDRDLAAIQARTTGDVTIAGINANATVQAAKAQASAQKQAGWLSFAGNLLSGLFSDRHVKKHLTYIRTDNNGLRWYTFRYVWESDTAKLHTGVIAQELLGTRFEHAVFVDSKTGWYKVNYNALQERQAA